MRPPLEGRRSVHARTRFFAVSTPSANRPLVTTSELGLATRVARRSSGSHLMSNSLWGLLGLCGVVRCGAESWFAGE